MKVVNSATFGTFLAHTLHFCETSIIETMHILCIGFGLQVHFIGVKEKYILKLAQQNVPAKFYVKETKKN